MYQSADRRAERLLPHPSVTVLRNRRWAGSGFGFLLEVCAVGVSLLVIVVALIVHSQREARFQVFSSKAQMVTAGALREDPEVFRGRSVVLHAEVVQAMSADGITELLVGPARPAVAPNRVGSASTPVVGAALGAQSADVVWVTFPGEMAVRAGAVVDVWGVGAGLSIMNGPTDHAGTAPAEAGLPALEGVYLRPATSP